MTGLQQKDPIGMAIEEAAKLAKDFLDKLINPALEESGGILADNIKFWRFKNQINIVLKAKAFLDKKGIDPKKVLPKTLIPILENGSLEEDEEMKEKWAALLANAADPTSKLTIRPSYPEILKQLSLFEIKLLDNFYESINKNSKEDIENSGIVKEKVLKIFTISSEEYDIVAENLFRLGLCQTPSSKGGVTISNYPVVLKTYDFIKLTPLGEDFIKACKY